jgi:protein AaeX
MIAEINLFGVFLSGALVMACLAGVALLIVRYALFRIGFYRFVWHRNLVDLALFVILWAAVAAASPILTAAIARVW